MQRPMFRRNGSPRTGERVSDLQTLLQDIRDTERLRSTVGDAESNNIQRQLGNLLRVPFEEFQGKYVRNPMSGEIEPMSGPLTGTVLREGERMMDPNSVVREGEVEMVTVIDRREGSETFGMPISVPRNMNTYEMIRSGEFQFDEIAGMAEGGEMKSDAVGIADGLDQETPKADPNTEGVAKVSPEQYVELMNQVRGDEVPLEGRVQELAMTVGEKDAQDTPLSVLALVQPVFELKEQEGGLAAAPGAQQMMQQAPMQMREGGIVYRANGTNDQGEDAFTALGSIYDPANIAAIKRFGQEYFGLDQQFDLEATRDRYKQLLFDKEKLRDQAYLSAAPYLLQLGATALDPEKSLSDIFTAGASGLAQFGTQVGKQTKALEDAALKMALQDKAKEESKESAFIGAIAPELVKNAFTNPQDAALKALDITSKTLDNAKKEIEIGVLPSQLQTELDTNIASLQKLLTENKYLPQSLQLDIETQLEQLYGIQYDNNKKQLDNEYQTIINSFVEGEKNAALEGQLLDNINKQLNNAKLGIENDYLKTEKDLGIEKLNADIESVLGKNAGQAITNEKGLIELENFDAMQTLELIQKQEEINKLIADQKELNFEQINSEASFRKEFKQLQVYKNTDQRYTAFNNLLAAASEDSAAGDVAFIFEFMRMVDPNSVVREGEFQLAEDASPLMLKLDKLLNKAKTGERLLSSQRDEFLSTAAGILDKSINIYNDTESEYKRIAGNIFKDSDVDNIVVGIQFDSQILSSLGNQKKFNEYLRSIGIDD